VTGVGIEALIVVDRVGDRYVVMLAAAALDQLAALTRRAADQAQYRGELPIPVVAPFLAAASRARALNALVPNAEPALGVPVTGGSPLIGVREASRLLGIGPRAVRKRIDAGTLSAQRVGRDWLIDVRECA